MYCKTEHVDIYYEIIGEGKPIVIIHGFSPDHRSMKGCLEPIFSKLTGWKRIYFDLPGMGKTKAVDWKGNGDLMLDIILQFINQIIPNERFLVVGESYGGYLARAVVLKKYHYVDGLFLLCSSITCDKSKVLQPQHQVFKKENAFLDNLLPEEDKEIFEDLFVIQDKRNWERFKEDVLSGVSICNKKFLEEIRDLLGFTFDVDKLPQPFEKPSLILSGRQDSRVGYKNSWDILDNYPRATFAVLDAAGHCLEIEQEILFNSLVIEWLDRVEKYPHSI